MAAQKDADPHDTLAWLGPAMFTGFVQAPPIHVRANPDRSVAAQNEVDGHDTVRSPVVPSISSGALHAPPFQVSALPAVSTATQNDDQGQDTETSPAAVSILVGAPHDVPSQTTVLPEAASTAMQNDAVGHEIPLIVLYCVPPSMLTGALQERPFQIIA